MIEDEKLQKVIGLWFNEDLNVPILELENGKVFQGKWKEENGCFIFYFEKILDDFLDCC